MISEGSVAVGFRQRELATPLVPNHVRKDLGKDMKFLFTCFYDPSNWDNTDGREDSGALQ